MSDRIFEGYLTSLDDIIKEIKSIANSVEYNSKGLDEYQCRDSLNWIAGCYSNILRALKSAYKVDMSQDKK